MKRGRHGPVSQQAMAGLGLLYHCDIRFFSFSFLFHFPFCDLALLAVISVSFFIYFQFFLFRFVFPVFVSFFSDNHVMCA